MGHAIAERPVVLIVEDDFLLRIDAADIILAAGFDVVEAGNADEAITVLEARSLASNQDDRDLWPG